jgi:hypothetical protein
MGDPAAKIDTANMCDALLQRADRLYERMISSPEYRKNATDMPYMLRRLHCRFHVACMQSNEAQMQQALESMVHVPCCEPRTVWSLAIEIKGQLSPFLKRPLENAWAVGKRLKPA